MTEGNTPSEVGLGFTVSKTKGDLNGKSALKDAMGNATTRNICSDIAHPEMVAGGKTLTLNGRYIGIVHSPCYSQQLWTSLTLTHVHPEVEVGASLRVTAHDFTTTAEVISTPNHGPSKSRTHA